MVSKWQLPLHTSGKLKQASELLTPPPRLNIILCLTSGYHCTTQYKFNGKCNLEEHSCTKVLNTTGNVHQQRVQVALATVRTMTQCKWISTICLYDKINRLQNLRYKIIACGLKYCLWTFSLCLHEISRTRALYSSRRCKLAWKQRKLMCYFWRLTTSVEKIV
jgi:hypothetical protein